MYMFMAKTLVCAGVCVPFEENELKSQLSSSHHPHELCSLEFL